MVANVEVFSLPPKKVKLSPSAGKGVLVACLDSCRIIQAHYMRKEPQTAKYYTGVILEIKEKNQRKTEKVASQASPEKCPSFA